MRRDYSSDTHRAVTEMAKKLILAAGGEVRVSQRIMAMDPADIELQQDEDWRTGDVIYRAATKAMRGQVIEGGEIIDSVRRQRDGAFATEDLDAEERRFAAMKRVGIKALEKPRTPDQ